MNGGGQKPIFGLYVHLPWCRTKCPYCDFNSYAAASWPERRYVDALTAELRHYATREPWRGGAVATIFFGGGTPSLFSGDSIQRLLDTARRHFAIARDAEITLEANPGSATAARLAAFRTAGVNRISFGIQSFQPHVLKVLGRLHTVRETRLAAPMARAAGFDDLNLDLIFAVPGQTLEDLRADLDEAIALRPEHVSAYNLTYEEGTPFHAMRASGRLSACDEETEARMFEETRARLGAAGYRAYEISNFALPGRESRHNLNYWRGGAYLGIGAGAHSYAPLPEGGRRWANEKAPERFIARVVREGYAVATEETLDRPRSAGEFLFLNLRLADGLAESDFQRRFGDHLDAFSPRLGQLVAEGLVERREGRVALTPRGVMLADSVFVELF